MSANFQSPQTAAPTLEKAAAASASLQTASCQYVYKRYGELGAAKMPAPRPISRNGATWPLPWSSWTAQCLLALI